MKRFWPVLVLALLLLGTACSLSNLTSKATPAPQGQTAPNAKVLFQDDFSNPDSGWDRVHESDGVTDYTGDGAYRIQVNTPNLDVWANPGLKFTDVRVEVDATKVDGPDDNDFGVLCRYKDLGNFYFFIISSDGYYAIGKVYQGDQTLLTGDSMSPSDAILQGAATNHLRADCVGSRLTFYVNGVKLAEVQDDAFAEGDVGLMAGTFDQPGTHILFDNFTVLQP